MAGDTRDVVHVHVRRRGPVGDCPEELPGEQSASVLGHVGDRLARTVVRGAHHAHTHDLDAVARGRLPRGRIVRRPTVNHRPLCSHVGERRRQVRLPERWQAPQSGQGRAHRQAVVGHQVSGGQDAPQPRENDAVTLQRCPAGRLLGDRVEPGGLVQDPGEQLMGGDTERGLQRQIR